MRWAFISIGVIMVLLGGLWALQGLNVMLGTPMSGSPFWVIVGAVVGVLGATLCFFGIRRGATGPRV